MARMGLEEYKRAKKYLLNKCLFMLKYFLRKPAIVSTKVIFLRYKILNLHTPLPY